MNIQTFPLSTNSGAVEMVSNTILPAPAQTVTGTATGKSGCGCNKRKKQMDAFVNRTKAAQILHIVAASLLIILLWKQLNKA